MTCSKWLEERMEGSHVHVRERQRRVLDPKVQPCEVYSANMMQQHKNTGKRYCDATVMSLRKVSSPTNTTMRAARIKTDLRFVFVGCINKR